MGKINFLKIALCLFLTSIAINNYAQSTGDIAFIAFNADGDDDFAIVALADIAANSTIYFSDNELDGSGGFVDFNEGELQWDTPASIITAGTVVVFTDTDSSGNANFGASVGTLTYAGSGTVNLAAGGDALFAYVGTDHENPTTFLTGIQNESGNFGNLTGSGLTEGTTFVNFYTSGNPDGGSYSGSRTSEASFSDYLTLIGNNDNWTIENSNGENILPISTTLFSISGSPSAGITLGAVSGNTNESGTTATFTVVLNAQPATDVAIDVSSDDTGEVTINAPTSLTFTNGNWDQTQTVTVTGVNDGDTDGNIDVTITVAVNDGSSDDDYDGISTSTTVTNEDDDLPVIVISEIMYNSAGTDDEWIEIHNANGSSVDISDWTIENTSGGFNGTFTFPSSTTIADGAYLTIALGSNASGSFNDENPFTPDFNNLGVANSAVASTSDTNHIVNSSSTFTLKNSGGTTIDTVTYDDGDGSSTDNNGDTFELVDPTADNSTTSSNWQVSEFDGGTPGAISASYWTGSTDNNWLTTGNWTAVGVPGSSANVVIPNGLSNYPTTSGAVTVGQIIIESGATLISSSSFTGNVTYERFLSSTNWYLLSSPVISETYNDDWVTANSIASGSTTASNRGVSTYDNSTNDGTTGHWRYLQEAGSGTFNVARGYGILKSSSGSISFIGSGIYTSNQNFTLSQGVNNFNLIGNPFTAFITLGTFYTTNSANIGTDFYFWNGSSYDTRTSGLNSSFEIAPGQGFFVEANNTNNVTFEISDASHQGTDTFQKSARPEVTLNITEGNNTRYAKVFYIDGTTKGYDNGYDGKLFGGVSHAFALYSDLLESDGNKYQLQSLPNSDHENMVVPIGVIAEAGKEITFTAEALNLPSGLMVFLEDRELNTITRLDEVNSNYKITLNNALNGTGRFYLHTASSALSINDINLEGVNVFALNRNTLRINGINSDKASVKLFNILGKNVLSSSFSSKGVSEVNLPNLSSGVYIVQLITEKGKTSKKIVLE